MERPKRGLSAFDDIERLDQLGEVGKRPRQPVELVDDDHVDLSRALPAKFDFAAARFSSRSPPGRPRLHPRVQGLVGNDARALAGCAQRLRFARKAAAYDAGPVQWETATTPAISANTKKMRPTMAPHRVLTRSVTSTRLLKDLIAKDGDLRGIFASDHDLRRDRDLADTCRLAVGDFVCSDVQRSIFRGDLSGRRRLVRSGGPSQI